MEIHNLMEELVSSVVGDVCREDAESAVPRYCTTPECRVDAVCYVLNRVPPRYVSSGRGFAHLTEELLSDHQLSVDLVRLAHEGLHRVSAVRRSFYGSGDRTHALGPCFNFPTLKGRLLDGATFTPVTDIAVTLLHEGVPVEMFDPRWSNPYRIPPQAPGTFLFWPAPVSAERPGIAQDFSFELHVEDPRFEPFSHYFSLSADSEDRENPVFSLERDFSLPDLYLFTR